jgi:excisionase family DNA binding protein
MLPDTNLPPIPRIALRVHEAAAAIGLSRSSTYRFIKEGKLPSKKVGGCTIIRVADLEAFVASL